MTPEEVARISPDNTEGLSSKQGQWVQDFFKNKGISPSDIEASQNTYADVQAGKYEQRLDEVRDEIKKRIMSSGRRLMKTASPLLPKARRQPLWRLRSKAAQYL